MSYNKRIKKLYERKNEMYNRYWENVSKKMQRLYFWECVIKGKITFEMAFEHRFFEYANGKVYRTDFAKDDEMLIEFYASKNGLRIVDEYLFANKSVYCFEKVN